MKAKINRLRPKIRAVGLAAGQIRQHPKYGLIYITSGIYEVNGRISNAWTFRKVLKDGRLSIRIYGDYGDSRWPTPTNMKVEIRVVEKKPKQRVKAA